MFDFTSASFRQSRTLQSYFMPRYFPHPTLDVLSSFSFVFCRAGRSVPRRKWIVREGGWFSLIRSRSGGRAQNSIAARSRWKIRILYTRIDHMYAYLVMWIKLFFRDQYISNWAKKESDVYWIQQIAWSYELKFEKSNFTWSFHNNLWQFKLRV